MGYTLRIGELKIDKMPDDGLESDCLWFEAVGVDRDDAPAYGEPTDRTNSRWPSYSAWAGTMRDAGLYDVFFCGGTLIGGHPGVRLVTLELTSVVSTALAAYRAAHPEAVAGFNPDDNSPGDVHCANLARLEWLDYWLRWSFANCETPVIANS